MLQQLWNWAENGQLHPDELRKKLLLAQDNEGFTAWHHAALNGSSEALEKVIGFAFLKRN
jgi:ankyrin repeat protein